MMLHKDNQDTLGRTKSTRAPALNCLLKSLLFSTDNARLNYTSPLNAANAPFYLHMLFVL